MRQTLKTGALVAAAASGIFTMNSGVAQADSVAAGAAAGSPGVVSGNEVQVPIDVPVNVCGNTIDVIALLNPSFGNACVSTSAHARHFHRGPVEHRGPVRHDGHPDGPFGGHRADHRGPVEHRDPVEHRGPVRHEHRDAPGRLHRAPHQGGAHAVGAAAHSPGVGSGNQAAVPVDVPVNVCGNTIDVVGLLNPVFGNGCADEAPRPPARHAHPPVKHRPPHHEHGCFADHEHHGNHEHHDCRPERHRPVHRVAVHTPAPAQAHHEAVPPKAALAATGAGETGLVAALAGGMVLGGVLLKRRARAMR